jgi:hypothetical protein
LARRFEASERVAVSAFEDRGVGRKRQPRKVVRERARDLGDETVQQLRAGFTFGKSDVIVHPTAIRGRPAGRNSIAAT